MLTSIIPAAPDPKKLTVRVKPLTLNDHFLAFMSSNNPLGYSDETDYEKLDMTKVGDVLIRCSMHDTMNAKWFKWYGSKVASLINASLPEGEAKVTNDHGQAIIARVLGYSDLHQMQQISQKEFPGKGKDRVYVNARKQSLKNLNLKIHNQDIR